MARKGKSGWFGDHRRHVLAGKGVSTVLPDGRRLDVSRFVAGGDKVGLVFEDKFEDESMIQAIVERKISNFIRNGYTSGDVSESYYEFRCWFNFHSDEDIDVDMVADLIDDGYTSGHHPSWSYSAKVWRDD